MSGSGMKAALILNRGLKLFFWVSGFGEDQTRGVNFDGFLLPLVSISTEKFPDRVRPLP